MKPRKNKVSGVRLRSLTIFVFLLFTSPLSTVAQQVMKTYYDYKKTRIHEEYACNGSGVKNGQYKEFSENGTVIRQGAYKDDGKVGVWTYNDPVAGSFGTETYDAKGVPNGKWLKYCSTNRNVKMLEGTYKDGKQEGVWIQYFCDEGGNAQNLRVEKEETYQSGQLNGKCTYYQENGEKGVGIVSNGAKSGEWKVFDVKGKMIKSHFYETWHGWNSRIETQYYRDGSLKHKVQYLVDGNNNEMEKVGEELYKDSTGVLSVKNVWHIDSIVTQFGNKFYTGVHEEYYPSGKILKKAGIRFYHGDQYDCVEETKYYENGNKKYECKLDLYGKVVDGSFHEFLEDGTPVKK